MNKQIRAEGPLSAQSHHTALTLFSSFPSKPEKLCHGGNEGLALSLLASLSLGIPDKEAVLYMELGLCVFVWFRGQLRGCLYISGMSRLKMQHKGHRDMNVAS